MSNYDTFVFAGHGKKNNGGYDPGAVGNGYKEADVSNTLMDNVWSHLKDSGLKVQYGNNNYDNVLISGNTYTSKCGISIHINAGGGTGVEALVPLGEGHLTADFELVKSISDLLKIPNRGVKSKEFYSEQTYKRNDGAKLNGPDYFKEVRDAWSKGISLTILEVGFIDTDDIHKIIKNIDGIGKLIANYILKLNGLNAAAPEAEKPKEEYTGPLYKGLANGKQFCDMTKPEHIPQLVANQLKWGYYKIELIRVDNNF